MEHDEIAAILDVGIDAVRDAGSIALDYFRTDMTVDNKLAGTVSLNAATDTASTIVWQRAFGVVGKHSVRVRTLGTVGRPGVAIDGFAVLR